MTELSLQIRRSHGREEHGNCRAEDGAPRAQNRSSMTSSAGSKQQAPRRAECCECSILWTPDKRLMTPVQVDAPARIL